MFYCTSVFLCRGFKNQLRDFLKKNFKSKLSGFDPDSDQSQNVTAFFVFLCCSLKKAVKRFKNITINIPGSSSNLNQNRACNNALTF